MQICYFVLIEIIRETVKLILVRLTVLHAHMFCDIIDRLFTFANQRLGFGYLKLVLEGMVF